MEHKKALPALGSLENEVSKSTESGVVLVGVLHRKCCFLGKKTSLGCGSEGGRIKSWLVVEEAAGGVGSTGKVSSLSVLFHLYTSW